MLADQWGTARRKLQEAEKRYLSSRIARPIVEQANIYQSELSLPNQASSG